MAWFGFMFGLFSDPYLDEFGHSVTALLLGYATSFHVEWFAGQTAMYFTPYALVNPRIEWIVANAAPYFIFITLGFFAAKSKSAFAHSATIMYLVFNNMMSISIGPVFGTSNPDWTYVATLMPKIPFLEMVFAIYAFSAILILWNLVGLVKNEKVS